MTEKKPIEIIIANGGNNPKETRAVFGSFLYNELVGFFGTINDKHLSLDDDQRDEDGRPIFRLTFDITVMERKYEAIITEAVLNTGGTKKKEETNNFPNIVESIITKSITSPLPIPLVLPETDTTEILVKVPLNSFDGTLSELKKLIRSEVHKHVLREPAKSSSSSKSALEEEELEEELEEEHEEEELEEEIEEEVIEKKPAKKAQGKRPNISKAELELLSEIPDKEIKKVSDTIEQLLESEGGSVIIYDKSGNEVSRATTKTEALKELRKLAETGEISYIGGDEGELVMVSYKKTVENLPMLEAELLKYIGELDPTKEDEQRLIYNIKDLVNRGFKKEDYEKLARTMLSKRVTKAIESAKPKTDTKLSKLHRQVKFLSVKDLDKIKQFMNRK